MTTCGSGLTEADFRRTLAMSRAEIDAEKDRASTPFPASASSVSHLALKVTQLSTALFYARVRVRFLRQCLAAVAAAGVVVAALTGWLAWRAGYEAGVLDAAMGGPLVADCLMAGEE